MIYFGLNFDSSFKTIGDASRCHDKIIIVLIPERTLRQLADISSTSHLIHATFAI